MASDSEASTDCFVAPRAPAKEKRKGKKKPKPANAESQATQIQQNSIRQNINDCQQLLKNVKDDEDNQLSDYTKEQLEQIAVNLAEMQYTYTCIKKEISAQSQVLISTQERLDDHQNYIDRITTKIPKTDELITQIRDTIKAEFETYTKQINETETLRKDILALVPADSINQQIAKENSEKFFKTNPATDTVYNRTIILTPLNRTMHPTGDSIIAELQKQRVNYPKASIEKIYTRPKSIEILCRTAEEARFLTIDLNNDDKVNKSFKVEAKRVPLQKIIILNVPTTTNAAQLKENISRHASKGEEINILRNLPNKIPDTQNWILLVTASTAKELIGKNGLYMGITRCNVRPYTSVLRCRRCQVLGHSTNTCEQSTLCENCSGPHETTSCTFEAKCINCHLNNRDRKTKYQLNHSPTAQDCPTYREFYQRERDRLTAIYNKTTINTPPQNLQEVPPRFRYFSNHPAQPHPSQDPATPPRGLLPTPIYKTTSQQQPEPFRFPPWHQHHLGFPPSGGRFNAQGSFHR